MTSSRPGRRPWPPLPVLLVLAVAVGCAGRRELNSPPDAVALRPWENAAPTGDTYPSTEETVAAGLAAAFGTDPGPARPQPTIPDRPLNVLVCSGGGKYGAFAAGVLNGWTASGTRPEFDVVTGISSGVLTATFAFQGPRSDPKLEYYFTRLERRDLYRYRPFRVARTAAVASSERLHRLIEQEMTDHEVAELACAYARGRRLFVATTNVMTRRLTVWDLTAIAASGRPDAGPLVRKVLFAATSIPGWTPPVEFDVTVNGCRYQELHADAGPITEGFLRTANGLPPGSNVYVVTAGKLYNDPYAEKPGLVGSMAGAVSNSLYAIYRADMERLYALCAVTKSNFKLIAAPPDVKVATGTLDFNLNDLAILYRSGYQIAANGIPWRTYPPGVRPEEQVYPRTGTDFVTR
jgi:hypothetical protein